MSSKKPDEKAFENHFCHQLESLQGHNYRKRENSDINKELCLNEKELIEFLEYTQRDEIQVLKKELGAKWKEEIVKSFENALKNNHLYEVLRNGIQVHTQNLKLVYFKPQSDFNPEELKRYRQNRFTYVRQYTIGQESIDLVLFLNGIAVTTIELKNNPTGQNINDAIKQYLERDLSLPIFNQPFVHIAADNEEAKYAVGFEYKSEDDFRPFNQGLVNTAVINEYATHYLYHDALTPDSLLEYIESYLFPKEEKWVFPRYHQRRAVKRISADILDKFIVAGELDLRYLVQHSAGSGKTATIIWLVQQLRNLFVKGEKLFDIIFVVTDRILLDRQFSEEIAKVIRQEGVVDYASNAKELREGIEKKRKVIVTTLHRFHHIQEALKDADLNRICFMIDESHRSQDGKMHKSMVETFFDEVEGEDDRKKFPNSVFVAFTATPSDKTLQKFGFKDEDGIYKAFEEYTMDEAIEEEYILDVVKNLITYDTLYELNYEFDSGAEYPSMQVYRALKKLAFEDDDIIREKSKIMLAIFRQITEHKISGSAKAMIVTSSRLAAVKYKLMIDKLLIKENLNFKTLVAFSGSINHEKEKYTESSMNGFPDSKTRIEFGKPEYRILIVANKFQTGFDQPYLHTMFLDKGISDINAVQTLSRLNRTLPPLKDDTLTVDFTDSYDKIIKAFRKFQGHVVSNKEVKPDDLVKLFNELLKQGIFTKDDINEVTDLMEGEDLYAQPKMASIFHVLKEAFGKKLDDDGKNPSEYYWAVLFICLILCEAYL